MKVLENTVISLDPEEYKQLYNFIKHKPSKRKRKDLLLLDMINKNGELNFLSNTIQFATIIIFVELWYK